MPDFHKVIQYIVASILDEVNAMLATNIRPAENELKSNY